MSALAPAAWPAHRLGEALELAAELAGAEPGAQALAAPPDGDGRAFLRWIDASAARLGVEAEPVRVGRDETRALLLRGAPALISVPGPDGEPERRLLLARATRRGAVLIGPDRARRRVTLEELERALWRAEEERVLGAVEHVLDRAGAAGARRDRARAALVREQLAGRELPVGWCVRLAAGAASRVVLRRARVAARVAALVLANLAATSLFLAAWAALGRGALLGRIEPGWLVAWALLLATMLAFRVAASRVAGSLAVDLGAQLKRRLLQGALVIDPQATRREGAGRLLARVLESEAVEALALGSGFLAVGAAVDLVLAAWVLAHAPAAGALLVALGLACATTLALALLVLRRSRAWTGARLAATHDLVERMIGHRTRLAQETSERVHAGEDELLAAYLRRATHLDRATLPLTALLPGAWLVAGVALCAPAFVTRGADPIALAIGLGGVLLAQRALAKLSGAAVQLGALRVAWEQVRPLFRAASEARELGVPGVETPSREARDAAESSASAPSRPEPLLETRRATFAHPGRAEPALRACDLVIRRGERVLLEGPSGGGKSTLAALLCGLERPDAGLVLLDGLDRATWGADAWRARVAAAPQFHQNHVFSATLAFNLLLGRGWPPTAADLALAEAVCVELGLGRLLANMPAGLLQTVGETGWQLSHGERSRVFLARALLSRAEVVVLDETFAALDPEALETALGCAERRAPTLLAIAHP